MKGSCPPRSAAYRRGLLLLMLAGLALRLTGIGWGLPGRLAPDEPPIHPDEHEVWRAAETLYSAPPPVSFNKGGAFYPRVGWLVRGIVRASLAPPPPQDYADTLLGLRLLNAAAAMTSAALLKSMPRFRPWKISEMALTTMSTAEMVKPMRRLPTKSKLVSPW